MKTLLLILMMFALTAVSQTTTYTYLKVADKTDFELYKKWCNDTIVVDIIQYGKATIVNTKTSGLNYEMYKMIWGNYTDKLLKDTVWYAPWKYGTKTISRTYGPNDCAVQRKIKAKVLRRVWSIDDYYKNRSKLQYK